MGETLLAIGTRKGLFLATSADRRAWKVDGPAFRMEAVYAIGIDTRRAAPRLLVGADSPHWGPSVFTSDDLGRSWSEPAEGSIRFPDDTDAALARVWQLQPGPVGEPDVVYAGVEPSALFRSTDGGSTYELVRALWDHPHRSKWFPGGGGQCLHTVIAHPTEPGRILVVMSTGGVYRTDDDGRSWAPANQGVEARFSPKDPYPEFGQCVHKVAASPSRPDQLFLQNHGGVYRSDDGGSAWMSIADGLPADFGFPVVAHPRRPGTAYVFPLIADSDRLPPDAKARVFRTDDEGVSWRSLSEGLPQEGFHSAVMRDAMSADDADPVGVYFGTRTGSVFASADEGEAWTTVADHFPDVLTVRAAVVA